MMEPFNGRDDLNDKLDEIKGFIFLVIMVCAVAAALSVAVLVRVGTMPSEAELMRENARLRFSREMTERNALFLQDEYIKSRACK